MKSNKILDVRVDFGMTPIEVVKKVEDELLQKEGSHIICTTNPEFIVDAQEDAEFKSIINSSAISTPDGIGTLIANAYINSLEGKKRNSFFALKAFLYGVSLGFKTLSGKALIGRRITGVELTHKFCELAAKRGYSILLIGGWPKDSFGRSLEMKEDYATLTAKKLMDLYPGLNVIGSSSKFSWKEKDDAEALAFIKRTMIENNVDDIDFMFVAFNHGKQEKWIKRNAPKIPAKISMGVGGTFDFILGHRNIAPEFFEKHHMSWLYRLVTQPYRMKRIFNAFPKFPWLVFKSAIK